MRDQKTPGGLAAGKTDTHLVLNSNQTSARRHILRQTCHPVFLVFRFFFLLFSKAARLTKKLNSNFLNLVWHYFVFLESEIKYVQQSEYYFQKGNGTRRLFVSAKSNWGDIYTQEVIFLR